LDTEKSTRVCCEADVVMTSATGHTTSVRFSFAFFGVNAF
jgi:hypothetical protein